MRDTSLPNVSIITVNFNGRFFLKTLFDSIANLNYPQEKLQVIMVDNGSKDGSAAFVRNNYPFVEILSSDKNLGFAGGNNAGAKLAKGDYIAFINNDCAVEREWLLSLVNVLNEKEKENVKIGGVGSKVLFYFKYLPLKISFKNSPVPDTDVNEKDEYLGVIKGLNIRENKITREDPDTYEGSPGRQNLFKFANKSFKYLSGFYDAQKDADRNITRKIKNEALAGVPVVDKNDDINLEIMVSFIKPSAILKISLEDEEIISFAGNDIKFNSVNSTGENISSNIEAIEKGAGDIDSKISDKNNDNKSANDLTFKTINIRIPKEKFNYCQDIVNSCGSMINKSFYAREIGYESFDKNTSDKPAEVFALPGSSFIIKKELIDEEGLFDEKFFTYYEDIDFFWRARLKGWRFFTEPKSVARHFHCGSGEEWSYSFTYHVLRNRLLMIYKCSWFLGFLKNYLSFCASAFINLVYLAAAKIRGRNSDRTDIPIRLKIFFEFFVLMVSCLGKRIKIRTGARISDKEIKTWQENF